MRTPGIWTARFRNHNSRQSQNMQQATFPRPNRRGPIEAGLRIGLDRYDRAISAS